MKKKAKKKVCKHKIQVEFRYVHASDDAWNYKGCVHCSMVKSVDGGSWHIFPYDANREKFHKYLIDLHDRQSKKESDAM